MYRFFDEITVSGASKSTVINKLLQKNVRIFRAECQENGIKFRIKPNDRQKVIEIFDAICYNYKIVKGIDKNSVFGFLKRRWAIAVLFALVAVMFALIPRYVYTVSVDAPSRLDKRQIFAGYRKYAAFYLKSDFFVRKKQQTFVSLDCRADFSENGYDGRREFHIFDFQRFFDFIQKHTKEYAKINAFILFKKEKPP